MNATNNKMARPWIMVYAKHVLAPKSSWIHGWTTTPACKVKLDDITSADMVCVTHGHDDHLGDAIALVKKTGAVLVTTPRDCDLL